MVSYARIKTNNLWRNSNIKMQHIKQCVKYLNQKAENTTLKPGHIIQHYGYVLPKNTSN